MLLKNFTKNKTNYNTLTFWRQKVSKAFRKVRQFYFYRSSKNKPLTKQTHMLLILRFVYYAAIAASFASNPSANSRKQSENYDIRFQN